MTAVKAFSLMDGYLGEHYPRRPVLPGALVVEALAQVGGMLNLVNHDFAVEMVLVLVDGVQLAAPSPPGEPLTLEVRMHFDNSYGATMGGLATAEGRPVATVSRLVFAHEHVPEPSVVARNRHRYAY